MSIMQQQLDLWLNGHNYHVHDGKLCQAYEDDAICLPDFSCCIDNISTPMEIKKEFIKAFGENDEEKIHLMLMNFLQNVVPDVDIKNVSEFCDDLNGIFG